MGIRRTTRVSLSTTNDMPHIQSLGVGDLSLFFFPFLFLEVQVRAQVPGSVSSTCFSHSFLFYPLGMVYYCMREGISGVWCHCWVELEAVLGMSNVNLIPELPTSRVRSKNTPIRYGSFMPSSTQDARFERYNKCNDLRLFFTFWRSLNTEVS